MPPSALSLDGFLRTVNKSVSELRGTPLQLITGQKFTRSFSTNRPGDCRSRIGSFCGEAFSGRRTVRVRFKNNSRPLYFDCVLNAIVKGGEVVGASVLGRDVTGQHEKELRFTELTETAAMALVSSTPEGRLLDANPALVRILGYATKEDLLALDAGRLNVDPVEPPVLGRAADDSGGVRTREITLRKKDGTTVNLLEIHGRFGMLRKN